MEWYVPLQHPFHCDNPTDSIYQDIFRVFDALNDIDQLEVGMKAVQEAGGVVEGTMCYSGDSGSTLSLFLDTC